MKIALNNLLADLMPKTRPILAAGAKAVEAAIRTSFRAMPSRSGFFAAQVNAGKVQTTELTDEHAVVSVDSRELAHYISGGTIFPIPPRKALAIPLTDAARAAGYPSNKRIDGIFMLKGKRGVNPTLCATGGYGLIAHWVLVPSVTTPAHPDAWPQAAIEADAQVAMQAALDAQAGR